MEEGLALKINGDILEAMNDKELGGKLIRTKNVSDFYEILSSGKELNYSLKDLQDYLFASYEAISKFISSSKHYSEKVFDLLKLYENICQDGAKKREFDSKKTINEVVEYFNSVSDGEIYSGEDVMDFYEIQMKRTLSNSLLLSNNFSFNGENFSNDRKLNDSDLDCAGGVGFSKKRFLSALGALSLMTSSISPSINSVHAYDNVASSSVDAEEARSLLLDKDYIDVDDLDIFDLEQDGNSSNSKNDKSGESSTWWKGGLFAAVSGIATALLSNIKLPFIPTSLLPKSLDDIAKLPDQIQKFAKMYDKLMNSLTGGMDEDKRARVEEMVQSGSNDVLFDQLARVVKGQNRALQDIVDLSLRPYLGDVAIAATKRQARGGSFFNMKNENVDPEGVKTYIHAIYGDRGVGKTRMMNTIRFGILRDSIPSAMLSMGSFEASGQKFIDWVSNQSEYIDLMDKLRYMRSFALFFDEFDKIKDDNKRREVLEVIREWSDKTQLKIKSRGSNNTEDSIQAEAGLILISSNAAGPNEKDVASWRMSSLTDDPSVQSRMQHTICKRPDACTADSVTNVLLAECQKFWFLQDGLEVEFDDSFTYNAMQCLQWLGYDPAKEGLREINNQLIPVLKSEFYFQCYKLKNEYTKLVDSGVSGDRIKFKFRWINQDDYFKKYNRRASGLSNNRSKGNRESKIVPELFCYVVGKDKPVDFFSVFDSFSGNLKDASLKFDSTWKQLLDSLKSWKIMAKSSAYNSDGFIAKYKILDIFNNLRYYISLGVASGQGIGLAKNCLLKVLNDWSKDARLTVAEEKTIKDELRSIISNWGTTKN